MAFLEFLLASARARIVTTDVLQRVTHGVMAVVAVRAMDMRMVVTVIIVVVVAIGTMHMSFVIHRVFTLE